MLLFGCYLIVFGHVSPGGGFQGGVVLASSFILLFLCYGFDELGKSVPTIISKNLKAVVVLATVAIATIACFSIGALLGDVGVPFLERPLPKSVSIFLLDIVIGLNVGSAIVALFYHMAKE